MTRQMPAVFLKADARADMRFLLRLCVLASQTKARLSTPVPRWPEQPDREVAFPVLAHLPSEPPSAPAYLSVGSGPQICRACLGPHPCVNQLLLPTPSPWKVLGLWNQRGGLSAPLWVRTAVRSDGSGWTQLLT